MIDLYNEVGYIKNLLKKGIGQKWQRDVTLLARYYKIVGDSTLVDDDTVVATPYKKKEIKAKILEKCEKAANRSQDPINFNRMRDYHKINSIIDKVWKDTTQLREIECIEIPKEVLDWFLGLEDSFVMTDEEVTIEKQKRPKVSIKHNKPINFERTKYLFTLYIWTKIQEHYLDKPNMHYIEKYKKRFKHDANLKPSFNLIQERNLLYDLGFIDVNNALGIKASFIDKYDVFKTPITNNNRIIIEGSKEEEQGDLVNCGYWLEKQKRGSFVCQNCGNEFAHYNNTRQEKGRKYCKECAALLGHNIHNNKDKVVVCQDCGKEINVSIKNSKTTRCVDCQIKHDSELTRLRVSKNRGKNVMLR